MSGLFNKTIHPAVELVCFAALICFSIAIRHPLYSLASLFGAVFFNLTLKNLKGLKTVLWSLPFFVFLSCLNPLVSHWGETVLFMVFGKPFTLEAFCYGLNMGLTFVVMLEWFVVFGQVLTTEKFTYLLGSAFPSVSLMMVMILRMLPFIGRRGKEIRQARKAMNLKGGAAELNAVVSSTLEDGVYTARTMEDRNYGKAKRTSFLIYSFGVKDIMALLVLVFLSVILIYGIRTNNCIISFYPKVIMTFIGESLKTKILFACWCLFVMLPALGNLWRK